MSGRRDLTTPLAKRTTPEVVPAKLAPRRTEARSAAPPLLDERGWDAVVPGSDIGKVVPITMFTRDTSALDRISACDWDTGLSPGAIAPVTMTDTFRDAFLKAFSS